MMKYKVPPETPETVAVMVCGATAVPPAVVPVNAIDVGVIEKLPLPPLPGALLEMTAEGTLGGVPEQLLGRVQMLGNGAGTEIFANYAPIQSPTQRLELLSHDQVVQVITGHAGPIFIPRASMPARTCGPSPMLRHVMSSGSVTLRKGST